jgi:hypothetical protein
LPFDANPDVVDCKRCLVRDGTLDDGTIAVEPGANGSGKVDGGRPVPRFNTATLRPFFSRRRLSASGGSRGENESRKQI